MPRLGLIWRWVVRVSALAYPMALLAVIAAFRWVGEGWWVTIAALYLPRLVFAVPLPFLALALALDRSWRWLAATQLAALALLLFPLMGLHLSLGHGETPGAPRFRLLTLNADSTRAGLEKLLAELRAADPDVIVIQECGNAELALWREGLPGYDLDQNGQFVLASRFPIEERQDPPGVAHEGAIHSPRFERYRLATPGGPIWLYNVHPISPRESLDELRGEGLGHEIASGRILHPATADVMSTTALRTAQLEAVVADAAGSPYPVIIAGDTNLPGGDRALARILGGWRDAFAEAGLGFGYTFPTRKGGPWMRIDRILAGLGVRFLACRTLHGVRISDHRAVVADVELTTSRR